MGLLKNIPWFFRNRWFFRTLCEDYTPKSTVAESRPIPLSFVPFSGLSGVFPASGQGIPDRPCQEFVKKSTLETRARIFVLVILAAFPALLLTVYSAVERRASTGNQARAELRRLVKLAAMQQWQVVEGARQMMVASSQILFTLLGDRKRCTEYFASLLAQNREAYHSMGLFPRTASCSATPRVGGTRSTAAIGCTFDLPRKRADSQSANIKSVASRERPESISDFPS